MKTYNNFNEMFNANKSVKSDLSVFNIKLSAGTLNCVDQYSEWLKEDSDAADFDEDEYSATYAVYEDRIAACLSNDLFLPENRRDYPVSDIDDSDAILEKFCKDAVDYLDFETYLDPSDLAETMYLLLEGKDISKYVGAELAKDYEPYQPSQLLKSQGVVGVNGWWKDYPNQI